MCVKIVFIFKKCNFYKGLRWLRVIKVVKELRPKRAARAKKAKRGKLRVSECVEVYLHTKRAKAGSSARSAVKGKSRF